MKQPPLFLAIMQMCTVFCQAVSAATHKNKFDAWLDIAGPLAAQLQKEIDYLADAYGGPTFPPHVTLVGGVNGTEEQIVECAKGLADVLQVFRPSLFTIVWQRSHMQCCNWSIWAINSKTYRQAVHTYIVMCIAISFPVTIFFGRLDANAFVTVS